jgi:hypothetical protein
LWTALFAGVVGWGLFHFLPSAGVFEIHDWWCGGLLIGALLGWGHWVWVAVRGKTEKGRYGRFGWVLMVGMAGAGLWMVQSRPMLAERELGRLGVKARKMGYSGLHAWALKRLGIKLFVNSGYWEQPVRPINRQAEFDRKMRLLSICHVTELNVICGEGVTSLRELGKLRKLKMLWLAGETRAAVDAMAELPRLEVLTLSTPAIESGLSALSGARALKHLHIHAGGRVVDFSGLHTLPKLTWVNLRSPGNTDGALLPDLPSLTKLDLNHAQKIRTLKGAAVWPNLNHLLVSNCEGLDVSELPNVAPNLQGISFMGAKFGDDFRALERLPLLGSLSLVDCELSEGITLPVLSKVGWLTVRNCGVKSVAPLAALAPNVKVLSITQESPVLELDGIERCAALRTLQLWRCAVGDPAPHAEALKRIPKVTLPGTALKKL